MTASYVGSTSGSSAGRLRLLARRFRERAIAAYRPVLYRGEGRLCPCCGRHFATFVSCMGRADAACPSCGSLERHRLLAVWLERQEWFRRGGLRILHIAPERGLTPLLRSAASTYVSGDLASPWAQERIDVSELPFDSGTLDLVVCNHVLEHVSDDRAALREIRRTLAAGGRAVLMAPIGRDRSVTLERAGVLTPQQRQRTYGQRDHVRLYGTDYLERVAQAGLTPFHERPLEAIDDALVARCRLRAAHATFELNDIFWAAASA